MTARLRFFGAAREVTGSMHLLEANGHTIALDCGLFQGRRAEAERKNRIFPFDPGRLDAVVLSHAHLDHCGKLPKLVTDGFSGPIHATGPTAELADIMLADSAHIQQEDTFYLNKKRARRGEPPIEPLYTEDDAKRTSRLLRPHKLGEPFEVVPGVRVTYHEAGHMLGSATILLEIDNGGGRTVRLVYTGDLGRPAMPILCDPAPLPDCDYLITESTYGGRVTPDADGTKEQFAAALLETAQRGGKVVVPSFAVGRIQAIVYYYHQLVIEGKVPRIPLFVDSPLALRATEVYRHHPEVFDTEATRFNHDTGDILECDWCEYVQNVEESKALHGRRGPLIILSASGMCEAGRILHHLKNNIGDAKNMVLIVGYQAANTLGRRLVERHRRVRIFGEFYDVRAHVKVLNGFSSHANAKELAGMTSPLAGKVQSVFIVHGEPDQSEALAAILNHQGFDSVTIPESGAVFNL